jgi:hypothetical protein
MIMILLSAGISASPSLLGVMVDQVEQEDIGQLQGSVDTIRTITIAIAHPIISKVFSNTIKSDNIHDYVNPINPFYICSLLSFLAFSVYSLEWNSNNNSNKNNSNNKSNNKSNSKQH